MSAASRGRGSTLKVVLGRLWRLTRLCVAGPGASAS